MHDRTAVITQWNSMIVNGETRGAPKAAQQFCLWLRLLRLGSHY